ncbi:hypothetical protein J7T55_010549 [Diaporthe amygdali]|uniref:uncharacterized protein n=1 Tax=Phomopsis amygdali TaxID=1214568 RepID=UPI0022FF193B|nr:uncharacterized protein J7T55_010549 [Diaporthe amygdali]KAJ0115726.1 hypothetical protein J7T55_010549 [Diaporthe amygdali]
MATLKHLTVSSDTDFTKHLDPDEIGYASLPDYPHLDDEDEASPPYLPRHATIDFFEMVTGRVADHFCVLEEVTLRYGTNISSTMCRCNEVTPCDRCEAFEILNPYVDVDDSKCRMQELSSDLDAHGIRFHVVDPEVYVYAFDPPLQ